MRYQTEVYKTVYQFLLYIFRADWRWPRKVRLHLETPLITQTCDLLLQLKKAQYEPKYRLEALQKATELSWSLEWIVRVIWDLGLLSIGDYERALSSVMSIQKQVQAWKNFVEQR